MSERGEEGERYPILIGARDGGYGAWCPDLPDCVALGDTVEECKREMREAIAFYIEGLRTGARAERRRRLHRALGSVNRERGARGFAERLIDEGLRMEEFRGVVFPRRSGSRRAR